MVEEKIFNKINLFIMDDYGEMCKFAADFILKLANYRNHMNLLMPAGTTPVGIYKLLSAQPEYYFNRFCFWNMDEYCIENNGSYDLISSNDQRSFRKYMNLNFTGDFKNIDNRFPTIENIVMPGYYDQRINNCGGLDLCINAMGEDGHTFGFNFPGVSFDSLTRLVNVNSATKDVNRGLTGFETPSYAITTGIKTGMSARQILFLVSGKRKADILHKVVYGPITEDVPATILRKHKNCIWLVDKEASSKL